MSGCELLGWTSILLQLLLGVLAFGAVRTKRAYEHPKREEIVFILDLTKQGCGWGTIHFLNILLAELFSKEGFDPCVWYFLIQAAGLMIGVPLSYLLLKSSSKCLHKTQVQDVIKSGYYGDAPSYDWPTFNIWVKQVAHWVAIIVVQRGLLALLFAVFTDQFNSIGSAVLAPLGSDGEVIFVVGVWPPLTVIIGASCVRCVVYGACSVRKMCGVWCMQRA
jgi:hypothetical protein